MNKAKIIGAIYSKSDKCNLEHRLYFIALRIRHLAGFNLTRNQLAKARQYLKHYQIDYSAIVPIENNKVTACGESEFRREIIPINPDGMNIVFKDYQKEGLGFLQAYDGCGLIADDMGLGKTAQALAYLHIHPELRPALVVAPAFLKINWKKEIDKFMPPCDVSILTGLKPDKDKLSENINIINYEILRGWAPLFKKIPMAVIIGDEIHKIKNRKAQQSKAFKKIAKPIPHKIFLTGTPILNRPVEIFNAIELLRPKLFNYWKFVNRYCRARQTPFGLDVGGHSNEEELNSALIDNGIMIRRLKTDVLKELPPKTYQDIYLQISNGKEYDEAEDDLISWLESKGQEDRAEKAKHSEALVKTGYLKRLAATGKVNETIKWIEGILDEGRSLVLFAFHKNILDLIEEKFGEVCCRVDGSASTQNKQLAVDMFQAGKKKLIIGNIDAMGVGWTLTASDIVAFLEYPWSPKIKEQAEDRIHRIGQESENITVVNLIGENTIDEPIITMLEKKSRIIGKIIDGKGGSAVGMDFLFKQLKNKKQ